LRERLGKALKAQSIDIALKNNYGSTAEQVAIIWAWFGEEMYGV